jgi:outer membrane protein assembly factor BamB
MKYFVTMAIVTGIAFFTGAIAAAASDPIEGKWYGMAGTPLDRVEVGFEFKRNDKGEIKAYVYAPVVNFYGFELPGVVGRDGNKYSVSPWRLSLTLKGARLEGSFLGPPMPISLKRTESLPSEIPVPDLPKGPGPKWQAKLGGAIYAPAAVRDGVAYVGTTAGIFYAIDVRDGSIIWTFVAGRPLHGQALATDKHLYFVCDNGFLFKLDRQGGKEVWRYDLGDGLVSRPLPHPVLVGSRRVGDFDYEYTAPTPVLADGVLYIGSGDGSLHTVSAATGTRIWRFQAKGKIRTDAALDGPRVMFGTFAGMVYALDRQTGKEIWSKDSRAEVTSSPVIMGDKLLVGNRGGLLTAFSAATGAIAWRMAFWSSSVESTPVAGNGSLFYIGSSDMRRISLIDSKDGRVLWRTDVFGIAWPRPAVTEKCVYAATAGIDPYYLRHLGGLVALDRVTGKIVWRWATPESTAHLSGFVASPVVETKTVVVGGLDGNLYGFPAG